MRYAIHHVTRYRYSNPVFLDPQTIRLRPREDTAQRLLDFRMVIDPEPAGRTHCLDPEGNPVVHVWFDGLTDHFEIAVDSEVRTLRSNPFDFILLDSQTQFLPVVYRREQAWLLSGALGHPHSSTVKTWSDEIARTAEGRTFDFLDLLNRRIYEITEKVVREEGNPYPAEQTLQQRSGSCRDLAVLFIEACRSQGLAARFVSGYQEGDPKQEHNQLHAWAEVFLPGGGWRGYDPSLCLAVADRHIPLAASVLPGEAAPLSGFFRGQEPGTLTFELKISGTPEKFQEG